MKTYVESVTIRLGTGGTAGLNKPVEDLITAAEAEGWKFETMSSVYVDRGGAYLVHTLVFRSGSPKETT